MADLVVPVRVAPSHEELRYALRSWCSNLPHARVWLIGHRPHWVSGEVGHIPTDQTGLTKWQATTLAVRAACEHPEVSERWLLMNDDFFTVQPLPDGMPVLHRGPLREVESRRLNRGGRDEYGAGLTAARERLEELGYDEPLCYEHHSPLPVEKAGMLRALEVGAGLDIAKRSVYGAVAGLGGTFAEDVKIAWRRPQGYGPQSVFVSTMPDAFTNGYVGKFIRDRFDEPCRYEKRGH